MPLYLTHEGFCLFSMQRKLWIFRSDIEVYDPKSPFLAPFWRATRHCSKGIRVSCSLQHYSQQSTPGNEPSVGEQKLWCTHTMGCYLAIGKTDSCHCGYRIWRVSCWRKLGLGTDDVSPMWGIQKHSKGMTNGQWQPEEAPQNRACICGGWGQAGFEIMVVGEETDICGGWGWCHPFNALSSPERELFNSLQNIPYAVNLKFFRQWKLGKKKVLSLLSTMNIWQSHRKMRIQRDKHFNLRM